MFGQLPNLDVWHTNDLFRKHPEMEDLRLYSGRKDDFVKLEYLTKFHGLGVEEIVERHPTVHRAIVGGDGRDSTCLLVELEGTAARQNERDLSHGGKVRAVDAIWLTVDKNINKNVADNINIRKGMTIKCGPAFQDDRKGHSGLEGDFGGVQGGDQ